MPTKEMLAAACATLWQACQVANEFELKNFHFSKDLCNNSFFVIFVSLSFFILIFVNATCFHLMLSIFFRTSPNIFVATSFSILSLIFLILLLTNTVSRLKPVSIWISISTLWIPCQPSNVCCLLEKSSVSQSNSNVGTQTCTQIYVHVCSYIWENSCHIVFFSFLTEHISLICLPNIVCNLNFACEGGLHSCASKIRIDSEEYVVTL